MSTTVVPINPREWQTRLWGDQSLWDGLPAMVLAEMHERVWNVLGREDEWEQVGLLALKHGYTDELESLVWSLEHPDPKDPTAVDPRWHNPPDGKRQAWVFDFPMDSIFWAADATATSILPQAVPVEPEPEPVPEPVTAVEWVVPRGRKRRRK